MRRPQSLPPQLGGAFTVADARAAGVSRNRLRANDLEHAWWGGRSRVPCRDHLDRLAGLVPLLPEGAAFSHFTCARIFGLPVPARLRDQVHVMLPPGRTASRTGVSFHHGETRYRGIVQGLPVLSPVQTWADCAQLLDVDELVMLGDAVLKKWPGALLQMRTVVEQRRGRRGGRKLRTAFALVRPNVRSPMETLTRLILVRAGIPEPLTNPEIWHDGVKLAEVDLCWPEVRVIVEYDGEYHFTEVGRGRKDRTRIRRLQEAGWFVIVVTSDEVLKAPAELVQSVRSALRRR